MASRQAAQHVLIGRPLLEALGLDTKGILEAVCNRQNGIVNVPDILPNQEEPTEGTLAKFIHDSGIFHSHNGDKGCADDDDIYIDLGEDTQGEVKASLKERRAEAGSNGASAKGQAELGKLLEEYEDVFRVRLGKSPPARVQPMKVKLKIGAKPVIEKARRYRADQCEFLNKYIDELEKMGFIRKNNDAQWVADPLLVPKDLKAKF